MLFIKKTIARIYKIIPYDDNADLQSVSTQYIEKVRKELKKKLGLIIGMGTDCKSVLSGSLWIK